MTIPALALLLASLALVAFAHGFARLGVVLLLVAAFGAGLSWPNALWFW